MSALGRELPFQSATEWLRFFEDNPEQDEYTWVGGQKIRFSDILRSLQQSEGSELERLRAIEHRAYECRTSGHLREVQAARYILTGKLEGESVQQSEDTSLRSKLNALLERWHENGWDRPDDDLRDVLSETQK